MLRQLALFRMHRSGWVVVAICAAIGIWTAGLAYGLLLGGLLVASLLVHEGGHMLAARALSVPIREFGLIGAGAYVRRAYANSTRDELMISAAGPLINLCMALPALFVPHVGAQLAMANCFLCAINLLPIPSSDGLHMVKTIWPSAAANRVLTPGTGSRISARPTV
jgi:Zn-dependent protease